MTRVGGPVVVLVCGYVKGKWGSRPAKPYYPIGGVKRGYVGVLDFARGRVVRGLVNPIRRPLFLLRV